MDTGKNMTQQSIIKRKEKMTIKIQDNIDRRMGLKKKKPLKSIKRISNVAETIKVPQGLALLLDVYFFPLHQWAIPVLNKLELRGIIIVDEQTGDPLTLGSKAPWDEAKIALEKISGYHQKMNIFEISGYEKDIDSGAFLTKKVIRNLYPDVFDTVYDILEPIYESYSWDNIIKLEPSYTFYSDKFCDVPEVFVECWNKASYTLFQLREHTNDGTLPIGMMTVILDIVSILNNRLTDMYSKNTKERRWGMGHEDSLILFFPNIIVLSTQKIINDIYNGVDIGLSKASLKFIKKNRNKKLLEYLWFIQNRVTEEMLIVDSGK
jgi:hypothetical protein